MAEALTLMTCAFSGFPGGLWQTSLFRTPSGGAGVGVAVGVAVGVGVAEGVAVGVGVGPAWTTAGQTVKVSATITSGSTTERRIAVFNTILSLMSET
jgi:hypothetical protein